MPLFKFNRQKKLSGRKKSSSMGSIYKDYSQESAHDGKAGHPGVQNHVDGPYKERIISGDEQTHFELKELQQQNEELHEENNVLKLKVEILLDMLAQKTAEAEIQESDLLKMRNILANS